MSDAHPSLRSCLYQQTATYYFIEALIHELVVTLTTQQHPKV